MGVPIPEAIGEVIQYGFCQITLGVNVYCNKFLKIPKICPKREESINAVGSEERVT